MLRCTKMLDGARKTIIVHCNIGAVAVVFGLSRAAPSLLYRRFIAQSISRRTAQMTTRTAKAKKATVQSIKADVQDKAKAAYAKGSAVAGELGTITKGNVAALVVSGKILGAGLKTLGDDSVADGKQAVDSFVADLKAFAAVKSPKEFFELQFQVAKRNIDTAVALGGKNGKAFGKLASDVAAPLAGQAKANVAKLRAVA
ncbi:MAG: phasin family protein [Novosphingobium sp.]|nr:MAG: phasin family protein [Novosphingobium sp.]